MIWLPYRKATLLIPAQSRQYNPHLYVLLTNAFPYTDNETGQSFDANIITSISTLTKRCADICLPW